jgi:transcriptional regulator with XRE-family HTH domain
MTIVEITGGMLRAARSLTGLSQQELADRASISRPCLTAWEGSSGSVPNANARALHRVVSALEAEVSSFVRTASICSAPLQPGLSLTAKGLWHERSTEPSGVQYLRLSDMQFLQNVSTSAASAGVLTQPRPGADMDRDRNPAAQRAPD